MQADALMFHHVYADLTFLVKSRDLSKSAYDMRIHYLELRCFLEEVMQHPEIVTERHRQVFVSETQLYEGKLNHRYHKHTCTPMECVQESLFYFLPEDKQLLFTKLIAGTACMKEKLCSYAADFLPNGLYWDPDPDTAAVLKNVDPSNDLCESILGLNDYLCTALPNMHQITKSHLVEIKKNHIIDWFWNLPLERQKFITDLAVKNRGHVKLAYQEEQKQIVGKRQENMLHQMAKKQQRIAKQDAEKKKLSKLHLISTVRIRPDYR